LIELEIPIKKWERMNFTELEKELIENNMSKKPVKTRMFFTQIFINN